MNWKPESVAERLQRAVAEAGGRRAVADRAGVPLTTLSDWLNGRDVRVSSLVALASACGVSVEWLATGNGAPGAGASNVATLSKTSLSAPSPSRSGERPLTLFSWADMERLGTAVREAEARFRAANRAPDARALGQATALLYDIATDEASKSVNSPPDHGTVLTDSAAPSEPLKGKSHP